MAMATSISRSSTVPSLPPPSPKSPPEYPDLYGKRREMARVQMLEREISFLEEEIKSVQGLELASRCCKEVAEFVLAKSDPLLPTTKKSRRSCRFWKWLCRLPCFNLSWICCCFCHGCSVRLELPSCCCGSCNCKPCTCPSISCSLPKWQCWSCPKSNCCQNYRENCCDCHCSNCCSFPSCCIFQCPPYSCPACSTCKSSSCCHCKCSTSCCSCPSSSCCSCPKVRPCCCCPKSSWNPCCLCC